MPTTYKFLPKFPLHQLLRSFGAQLQRKTTDFFFVFFFVILVGEIKLGRKYFLIIPKHQRCL
jgi:hypothetical protein